MSRSYRKPYVSDKSSCKNEKVAANRWLRRSRAILKVGQRNSYKKFYCSWDIRDYRVLARTDIAKFSRK